MVVFLFILLGIQLYIYVKVDYQIYGTYYTPTTILTLPYLGVLFTYIILHNYLEFKDISGKSVLIWNIGTLLFWISGLLLAKLSLKKTIKKPFSNIKGLDITVKGLNKYVILITYLFVAILVFSFYRSIKILGISSIGSEDFAKQFAGGGVFGHSLNILRFLLVYLIIKVRRKSYQTIVAILLIIIFNLLYMVKGWLFIPLIAGAFTRVLFIKHDKITISFKLLKESLYFVLVSFSIFAGFYYLNLGNDVPFKFIFIHFFHYLWSGIIGFSEYLNSDVPIGEMISNMFNPIVNMYLKLIGNNLDSVVNPHYFNSQKGDMIKLTNVSTFFGSIYISSGATVFAAISIFFSLLIHLLFFLYLKSKNIFILILYSLFATGLFFGWFNFYFQHLFYYIIILLAVTLNLLINYSTSHKTKVRN